MVMEILVGAWDEVVCAVEVLGEKVDLFNEFHGK